ncbi:hypothetical protein CPB83DRAFT_862443 [Crepidotus variabilis]|uniref:Heat shock 70 kDa protein 12A n=1 Tax=Crepidotus variabilis TaxID=179855 RepID=A0A9P6E6Z3_9AGAR|nr:hypothetical protein CPB83DRAFT_862443 [Crepidotus variabilis]
MSAPKTNARTAYSGSRRKLVLAFDVGTTFSGISYCILDPGQIPGVKSVTRFPAQETSSGASKIPTIIYYDPEGRVRAVGAEAAQESIYDSAIEGEWYKAEWFKLHLRSKFTSSKNLHESIPDLPPNKTVVDVVADFLSYLLNCASTYIRETYPNGDDLWNSFASATGIGSASSSTQTDGIQFVLSHPNGWEGKEQAQMRQAAVQAKLVPDTTDGHKRVSFVTEGEASLHFAVENGLLASANDGEGIVVVDAGGGTVDVSTYKRSGGKGQKTFEEIAVPKCYFHGSVFVTLAAKDFLRKTLSESPFLDDLDHITACFDKTTKTRFRNAEDPQYVKFGSARDNDADVQIRFGQMRLAGKDVAEFFQPSVDCVVEAVLEQIKAQGSNIRHMVLVGGFGASDWLYQRAKDRLAGKKLTISRPENNVNKAVSDGAISFHLDHYVRTRVSKVTYGCHIHVAYKSNDPEHVKRPQNKFTDADDTLRIKGYFQTVLKKDTQVTEEQEFRHSLTRTSTSATDTALNKAEVSFMCYRGEVKDPKWLDVDADNYTTLFTLSTNSESVPRKTQRTSSGKTFYSVEYEVVILFGLTELQAQLRWFDKGVEKRSAASMIYDS